MTLSGPKAVRLHVNGHCLEGLYVSGGKAVWLPMPTDGKPHSEGMAAWRPIDDCPLLDVINHG